MLPNLPPPLPPPSFPLSSISSIGNLPVVTQYSPEATPPEASAMSFAPSTVLAVVLVASGLQLVLFLRGGLTRFHVAFGSFLAPLLAFGPVHYFSFPSLVVDLVKEILRHLAPQAAESGPDPSSIALPLRVRGLLPSRPQSSSVRHSRSTRSA